VPFVMFSCTLQIDGTRSVPATLIYVLREGLPGKNMLDAAEYIGRLMQELSYSI